MSRQPHVSFKLEGDPSGSSEAEQAPATISRTNSITTTVTSEPLPKRVSVAIIIIGDEILKGQVADVNSHYLCQRLTAVGADVKRVSIIPDTKDAISQEIRQIQSKVRWIITAGGVGPTHDDVTYEGIANAFNLSLERNETLVSLIRQHFSKGETVELTLPEKKLATVPQGSIVMMGDIRNGDTIVSDSQGIVMKPGMFPVVRTRNVLIMPGIPVLLQRAFNSVRHLFESEGGALTVRAVYVKRDELTFAERLTAIADAHKPFVVIGSYPDITNNYYRVKVLFESADPKAADAAVEDFVSKMPSDNVILDSDMPGDVISEAEERVSNFVHPSQQLCSKVAHALNLSDNIIRQFGHDNIAICFTGGKDCTAVLHILFAALRRVYRNKPAHLIALQLSTFETFPEVDQFIDETKRRYGFQFISYTGTDMKETLKKFVEDYPHIKVVFMGTRRNDPSASKLAPVQKTDAGWPELIRVSPILDWTYAEIWSFIRSLHLPYCSLYDRGYTSLGNPSTTHPNRLLLSRSPSTSLLRYRPAWELAEESAERAGRDSTVPPQTSTPNHK